MGYEYRRLTPEERAAIVQDRRERGYPLHGPPHPYRDAGWYCLTATNLQHVHVMGSPARRTELEDRLLSAMVAARVEVAGWVILSNHYHLLADVESLDQISAILKQLHGSTARQWNLEDGLTGKRHVWFRFFDRFIRTEQHYYHALNYIHYNAVKHGYVDSPYDWPWSSVLRYYDTCGREWLREKWVRYPIGSGWDYGD